MTIPRSAPPGVVYGIDLGTTYTKCAVVEEATGELRVIELDFEQAAPTERTPSLRSAITLGVRGKEPIAYIGSSALIARRRWREGEPPQLTKEEMKMWLGADLSYNPPELFEPHGFEYRPETFCAFVLRRVAMEVERAGLPRLERVVITHPQVFTAVQRQAVRDAASIAKLDVVDMLTEPDAAAYAYAKELSDGKYIVFDFGGGTLDIVALEIQNGTAHARTSEGPRIAGRDFDKHIYEAMLRQAAAATSDVLRETLLSEVEKQEWLARAEWVKRRLNVEGRDPDEVLEVSGLPFDARREIALGNLDDDIPPWRFKYTLRELERELEPRIIEAREATERRLAHLAWSWNDLSGVLMVGGSTRLLAIRRMLRELAGGRLIESIDPMTAVARGAALYARDQDRDRRALAGSEPTASGPPSLRVKGSSYTGALSRGLGIELRDRQGYPYISPLLAKDTRLPLAKDVERTFRTEVDGQREIEIALYEGESTDPDMCDRVGSCLLTGFPAGPAGTLVLMKLGVEANGRHRIVVKIGDVEREQQITFDPSRLMRPRELLIHRDQVARVHVLSEHDQV